MPGNSEKNAICPSYKSAITIIESKIDESPPPHLNFFLLDFSISILEELLPVNLVTFEITILMVSKRNNEKHAPQNPYITPD